MHGRIQHPQSKLPGCNTFHITVCRMDNRGRTDWLTSTPALNPECFLGLKLGCGTFVKLLTFLFLRINPIYFPSTSAIAEVTNTGSAFIMKSSYIPNILKLLGKHQSKSVTQFSPVVIIVVKLYQEILYKDNKCTQSLQACNLKQQDPII